MKKLLLGLSLAALPLTFSLTAMGECQPSFEITRLCEVDHNRIDRDRACDEASRELSQQTRGAYRCENEDHRCVVKSDDRDPGSCSNWQNNHDERACRELRYCEWNGR